MRQDDARRAILDSIRSSLTASKPHDAAYTEIHAHHRPPPRSPGIALPILPTGATASAPIPVSGAAQFGARLEAVGGRCVVVRDRRAASAEIAAILSGIGARRVAISDAPLVRDLIALGAGPAGVDLLETPPLPVLFECDAGITSAQWAIAESGTLVVESAHERNRLASLVPPVHIAVLPTSRMCERLGDALERLRGGTGELPSRSITMITGPSRTADIEQTLVMGVHGPQQIHVVLIESDEAIVPR